MRTALAVLAVARHRRLLGVLPHGIVGAMLPGARGRHFRLRRRRHGRPLRHGAGPLTGDALILEMIGATQVATVTLAASFAPR